jgi:hypothetical protein
MPDARQIMIFNQQLLKNEIKRIWFHPKALAIPRASI